jgi:D-ribose pyranose/furanose isomerase RbsD
VLDVPAVLEVDVVLVVGVPEVEEVAEVLVGVPEVEEVAVGVPLV